MVKYKYSIDNQIIETLDKKSVPQGVNYETVNEEDFNEDNLKFRYNNSFILDTATDFSEWKNFYLTGFADINEYGDKSKISWKDSSGAVCIEEYPVYIRTKIGTGLLANFILKRDLTILFYKKDNSYQDIILPQKIYSDKERIDAEKKSRANIIDKTRDLTGKFIYQKNVELGTPEKINNQLLEALATFKTFATELSVYREDREIGPLVDALTLLRPTLNMPQDTINFILNSINKIYY